MDTFKAIKERRSVKNYDTNHKITNNEINQLLSLAILSPTSFNMQNWRFVVVKNPKIRKEIRSAAWDQAHVTDASLLLVICADLKLWKKILNNTRKMFQEKLKNSSYQQWDRFMKVKRNYKEMRQ